MIELIMGEEGWAEFFGNYEKSKFAD